MTDTATTDIISKLRDLAGAFFDDACEAQSLGDIEGMKAMLKRSLDLTVEATRLEASPSTRIEEGTTHVG